MQARSSERGQVFPLVAIALVVLMGAAGFAVDVGYHQYRQRLQQTATDSAALAGAKELLAGDYVASARQDASSNGFTDNSGGNCTATVTCVVVSNPPVSPDAYAGNNSAVEVVITAPNQTFFESVFGINNVSISTKAVAVLSPKTSPACLITLLGNSNFNGTQNGGTINAPSCAFILNGGANFNNSTVDVGSIECGTPNACSNGTFTGATPAPVAPVSDPCPAISYCAYLASHPPTTCSTSVNLATAQAYTATPGCYGGMNLKKATTITFNCGLYVFTGVLNVDNAAGTTPINVNMGTCGTGQGVTMYFTGGGQLKMINVNVNLSAPTTGDYSQYATGEQNVLFYQTPGDTNTANLQSATCATCSTNVSGMMYFPTATLNYNQSNSQTSNPFIVDGTLNMNGSSAGISDAPAGGGISISVPILGE